VTADVPTLVSLKSVASAFERWRVTETYLRALVVLSTLKAAAWAWVGHWNQVPRYVLLLVVALCVRFLLSGRTFWRRVAASASLGALTVELIGNSAGALWPSAPVVFVPYANAAYLRVIALAAQQAATPAFWTARAIPAVVVVLIGVELGALGVWFLRASPQELALLAEPALPWHRTLLHRFLDIQPGVFRYARRDTRTLLLLLAATIVLTWVAVDICMLPQNQHDRLSEALGDCVGDPNQLACVAAAGRASRAGVILEVIFLLAVWPTLGSQLQKWGYLRAAKGVALDFRNGNLPSTPPGVPEGKSVLFLRAFQADKNMLARPPFSPLRYALSPSRTRLPLDALLIRDFASVGVPLALGIGDETTPPFGAMRRYVDDAHWRQHVAELATAAVAIVFVFDQHLAGQKNLAWELQCLMASPDLRAKTICLVHPPPLPHRQDLQRVVTEAWRVAGNLGGFAPPTTSEPLLSLQFARDGAISGTTAPRVDRTTVLLALRHGFRRVAAG